MTCADCQASETSPDPPDFEPGTVLPVHAGGSPVFDAIVVAAVDATTAGRGWLLAATQSGEELLVVAGHGADARAALGARGPMAGWSGSVLTSGRALAVAPEASDPRFAGDLVLTIGPRPASLLCFPCSYGGQARGALQLVDKVGGGPFSLDDVELVTLLAEVAGAALHEASGDAARPAPRPEELRTGLRLLAAGDPHRYAAVAGLVGQLLPGD